MEKAEATTLSRDALCDAQMAGVHPSTLYGPAQLYADTLSRAARSGAANAAPLPRQRGEVVLRLRQVSKTYGRRVGLHRVDLELRAGEVAVVVGSNGSGKSTLLDICAGVVRASSGTIERCRRIGYVPQHRGVMGLMTVDEHLRLFGAAYGMNASESVAVGRRLAAHLGWRQRGMALVSTLSGGTQQKLNVVLGELDRPDLILLDEPYQGFDRSSYLDFWDQVFRWRDAGAGVLVVAHILHDLDRMDHVIELAPAQEQ